MRQPNGLPHHLQEEGERHGDEAAAAGHDAVGQAKAALEVVTKDDERGLEGQGAAAAEEDPVREITNFQRPSGKKKKKHIELVTLCRGKEAFSSLVLQNLESRPWSYIPQVLHRQSDLEELMPWPKRGLSSFHRWHVKSPGKRSLAGERFLHRGERSSQPALLGKLT